MDVGVHTDLSMWPLVSHTEAIQVAWKLISKGMCRQDSSFRGLVPLGIGAVGGSAVASFNLHDSQLFKAAVEASPHLT